MRRTVPATLTLIALLGAAALAQEPSSEAAPTTPESAAVETSATDADEAAEPAMEDAGDADAPTSRPLVPPPPKLEGPEFQRMRGLAGPPPSAYEKAKITNFFFHIRGLIEAAQTKPMPEPKKPSEPAKSPQTYPFEDIEGLTSKDFMRAVREGARDARDSNFGKSEDYINRQIEANARLILEYYPLVATDIEAHKNIFYVMEDAHAEPIVRRMFYRLAVPGRSNDSLFARYVQDTVRDDTEHAMTMYGIAITTQGDDPIIRQLAVENLYATRLAEFKDFLASDLNAEAFRAAKQRNPLPTDLTDPEVFAVSSGNRVRAKKFLSGFADMAKIFSGLLKPTSDAPQQLRDATIAVLNQMQAEIPLEDAALIPQILEEAATASTSPAPQNSSDELAF